MLTNGRQWIVAATPLLLIATGCVGLDCKTKDLPIGVPMQAAAYWKTYVLFGADPAHDGAKCPALAGRVVLYSQAGTPVVAPGKMQVRLFSDMPGEKKSDTPLEVWELDADTLKGKLQRDVVGWGYSLILPWGTYNPELTHVRLTVRFEPATGGMPLFAQESRLTLHGDGPPKVMSSSTEPVTPRS
jgi:hypothetical protein